MGREKLQIAMLVLERNYTFLALCIVQNKNMSMNSISITHKTTRYLIHEKKKKIMFHHLVKDIFSSAEPRISRSRDDISLMQFFQPYKTSQN